MKRCFIILFSWFSFLAGIGQNQTINLAFNGRDSATQNPVTLDSVEVRNITAECDTTVYGPSPSLRLVIPSGIGDQLYPGSEPVTVLPPVPNPFTGRTTVTIRLNQSGPVTLILYDPLGNLIAHHQSDLKPGMHHFGITTSVNTFLVLNVKAGNISRAVKLISQGNDPGDDRINYLGFSHDILKSGLFFTGFIFRKGDLLSFTAMKSGYYEKVLSDTPASDTAYSFILTMMPTGPVVVSDSVTAITPTTATGAGNVTSDGGAAVTGRGFCWDTAFNPTLADPHTADGSGLGPFVSYITGLDHNTTYHGRAYAINSADTSYGADVEFKTLPVAPSVVTLNIINITPLTAEGSGEVTDDGGAAVTERGFCWSTSPDPTVADPHTSDGFGTGSFQSNISGLNPDVTWYGRAYAINSADTSYGENISFYTPGDGFYIKGTATAYSEFNKNALMKITRNEVIQVEDPNLLELYIPVKSGSDGFNIVQVTGVTMKTYGPGQDFTTILNGTPDEPKVPFQRGSIIETASRFTVPEDGMYHVVIYLGTLKAVVVPVHWGLCGTPFLGWGASLPMTGSGFDLISMNWTLDSLELTGQGQWKFRYSDGWKIELDTTVFIGPGIVGVKANTNFGQAVDSLVPGGPNIFVTESGLYTCNMEYTLGSGYTAELIKTGPLPPVNWTGVLCDAVGTGISLDNPTATPDTSAWHWGNQMLGDNGGVPAVSGLVYTWTWTGIILEAFQGFKVRTLNGVPSPVNGIYFDSGYNDLNIAASAPEIISGGPPNYNLMTTLKASYTITLHIDAANENHRELIIVKN